MRFTRNATTPTDKNWHLTAFATEINTGKIVFAPIEFIQSKERNFVRKVSIALSVYFSSFLLIVCFWLVRASLVLSCRLQSWIYFGNEFFFDNAKKTIKLMKLLPVIRMKWSLWFTFWLTLSLSRRPITFNVLIIIQVHGCQWADKNQSRTMRRNFDVAVD